MWDYMATKLEEIAKRAASIRMDTALRHVPNGHDLSIASEHSKLMSYPQYQTIKNDKESE